MSGWRRPDSAPVVTRSEAERQALALIDAPVIAAVFDGVTTQDDCPVPKIIDLGVAEATARHPTDWSLLAELGAAAPGDDVTLVVARFDSGSEPTPQPGQA